MSSCERCLDCKYWVPTGNRTFEGTCVFQPNEPPIHVGSSCILPIPIEDTKGVPSESLLRQQRGTTPPPWYSR